MSISTDARIDVRKTYKLYIGGAFLRSESGRSYVVTDHQGIFLANAAHASRKDARDAVVAARKAVLGWAGKTAHTRGQIVYRIAEVLEGRRSQFVDEVHRSEGGTKRQADTQVDTAIDRLVWYAGWADKISQIVGGTNPVAAPYFNFSVPEPTGVVAIAAPQDSSLLGLISVLAPAIITGNTSVLVTSHTRPLPAITLSEVLATADLSPGVVNILTGDVAEVGPWLAGHMDVNALDLTGVTHSGLARSLEQAAAENLKRIRRPGNHPEDWYTNPSIDRMTWTLETKTVWHPVGI